MVLLMQFSELYCSEKGGRALDYVHNVILDSKTVHYSSYYIENIITNLQSSNAHLHMQASNAENKA